MFEKYKMLKDAAAVKKIKIYIAYVLTLSYIRCKIKPDFMLSIEGNRTS